HSITITLLLHSNAPAPWQLLCFDVPQRYAALFVMILKPRIDIFVAMLLGGTVIAFIGFGSAVMIGLWAGLVPAVVGTLGLLWITIAIAALRTRLRLAIKIDNSGITLPTGNVFRGRDPVHIP